MFKYQMPFRFDAPLKGEDIDDAKEYLAEDDMTQYFYCEYRTKEEQALKDVLVHVEWVIDDIDGGNVDVISLFPLDDRQIELIEDEIKGQNSDGLGEGFEQHFYSEPEYYDDDEYEYDEAMCSISENGHLTLVDKEYTFDDLRLSLMSNDYHHIRTDLSDLLGVGKSASEINSIIEQAENQEDERDI